MLLEKDPSEVDVDVFEEFVRTTALEFVDPQSRYSIVVTHGYFDRILG